MSTPTMAYVPELLTLNETAALLKKSPKQLSWMIHRNTAPRSALIGGRRMFRASDVTDFINEAFDNETNKEGRS